MEALSGEWQTKSMLSIDELNGRIFNPFELNEINNSDPLSDIDPYLHYLNTTLQNLGCCEYYTEDAFNNKCQSLNVLNETLSVLQFNIRSAKKNLSEFQWFLESLAYQFTIIGLSETWFKDETCDLYSLDGYQVESNHREKKCGVGVALMIRNELNYEKRSDLNILNENVESVFVEIDKSSLGVDRNMLIGSIYRPPNTCVISHYNYILNLGTMHISRNHRRGEGVSDLIT